MNFLSFYLLTAGLVFAVYLAAFWRDNSTPKQDRLSWIIILCGALFWGIVLPLAIVERSRKLLRHNALASR